MDLNEVQEHNISEFFNCLTKAFEILRVSANIKPLFIVDDIQLLFNGRNLLANRFWGLKQSFQWILECENDGLLDVIMCCSEKSVLSGIRQRESLTCFCENCVYIN